jgi:spore maturation protein CgeB
LLGGADWDGKDLPGNVEYVGHVCPRDRNTFNCSARAVLNISRDSAALSGFSPSTRLFEAAGAGACVITDDWEGIELFLEPGPEILVAQGAGGVVEHVRSLTPDRAREIGRAARKRILAESTYAHRAIELESALRETSDRTAYGADRDAFGTYPVELVHSGSG